jgi:hypothetical protein
MRGVVYAATQYKLYAAGTLGGGGRSSGFRVRERPVA